MKCTRKREWSEISRAGWEVYVTLVKGGHKGLARMTLRNLMAQSISVDFPQFGWGPSFRIGLRRWW